MALTLVGTQSAAATTVTIPAHQKGDLLVFFAYRGTSTTPATRPVGIADIGPTTTKTGTTQSLRLGYKVATGTSDTSGTWTNASELTVHVLRPDPGYTAVPGQVAFSSSTTTTITFPALTLGDTSGLSWVLGFVGSSNTTQTLGTAPTGMTNRQHIVGASNQAASDDSNGGVSSWSVQTITAGAGNSVSATLEILCLPQTLSLTNVYGHIGGGSNPFARGNISNNFVCPLSVRASGGGGGAGNTILFAFTCDGGATVTSVTGAVNGAFTLAKSALGGAGNLDSYVYYAQGIAQGQETVTVSFFAPVAATAIVNGTYYTITFIGTTDFTLIGATSNTVGLAFTATGAGTGTGTATPAVKAFTYAMTELYNVATTGGLSGSVSAAFTTTLAAGSFTPTNNNANGGNFVWAYFSKADQIPAASSTHFLAGTGFTLLSADSNYAGSFSTNPANGLTKCVEYQVQGTSAAVNPGFESLNETGDHWNCIAVSIAINNGAGTPIPSGMGVNRIAHFATESFPTTGSPLFKMQLPVNGNFRLLMCDDPSMNVQTITDSEGNTWTAPTPSNGGTAGIWYLANAQANPNLFVYANGGGTDNELSFRFFDVIGADPNPQITCVSSGQTVSGLTSFTMSPAPTPTATTGMTFVNIGLGQGPGLAATAPTYAIWDLCTYTGELDFDEIENADIMAHGNFTTAGAQTWTFSITNAASNSTSGGAITVSGAPPPIQWIRPSAFQTPKIPGGIPFASAPPRRAWAAPATSAALSGSGISATSGSAALTGTATLAGTGISLTLGVADVTGNEPIAGSGISATAGLGNLTGSGALASIGISTTSGAGSLTASGSLASLGISATSGAGAMTGAGALSGSGISATSGLGDLEPLLSGAMGGSGISQTSGAGALAGAQASSGSGISATSGAGTLTGSGALFGVGISLTLGLGDLEPLALTPIAGSGVSATAGLGDLEPFIAPPPTPPAPPSGSPPGYLPGKPPRKPKGARAPAPDPELGKGLGPHKRPGQIFGEQDPWSPTLTGRAADQVVPGAAAIHAGLDPPAQLAAPSPAQLLAADEMVLLALALHLHDSQNP